MRQLLKSKLYYLEAEVYTLIDNKFHEKMGIIWGHMAIPP